jgi:ATP-dependent helicase/nuclease subunit A
LRWQLYQDEDLPITVASVAAEAGNSLDRFLDPVQIEALRQRLTWKYPFAAATVEPAKTSVSELRRRVLEESETEVGHRLFLRRHKATLTVSGALSAAEIGTAHHLFLQFVSLDNVGSVDQLASEAERLERSGVLSGQEREALDLPRIAEFWQSGVGRQILTCRCAVHRELPFTVRMSGIELGEVVRHSGDSPGAHPSRALAEAIDSGRTGQSVRTDSQFIRLSELPDEFVVVQGVVDLAVIQPDSIWFLDFKTDDISGADGPQCATSYRPQLQLYSLAFERIYRRPVTQCWLHFLRPGRTIEFNFTS